MRLTPMQQLAVMRDGLMKIKTFGSGPLTVQEIMEEADALLQLPLIGAVTTLEPELTKLKHWKELRRARRQEAGGR